MPAVKTPFIVAAIRHREAQFLEEDEYTRLIDAHSSQEALDVLLRTIYGEGIHPEARAAQVLATLTEHLASVREWLADQVEDPRIMKFISARYDGLNVATALIERKKGEEKPGELSPLGTINHSVLYSALWNNLGWRYVPSPWDKFMRHELAQGVAVTHLATWQTELVEAVEQMTVQAMAAAAVTPLMRRILTLYQDRLILDALLRQKRLRTDLVTPLVRTSLGIDPTAAELAKKLDIAGYRYFTVPMLEDVMNNQHAEAYEKAWDEELLASVRPYRFTHAGYDAILAYWYAKELEVTNIRILLTGKLNQLTAAALRQLQRSLYLQRV